MKTLPKKVKKPNSAVNQQVTAQLQSKLQLALTWHQRGHLAQARELYQQVLHAQANNFDALHLLGMLEAQTGNSIHAVELLNKAIKLRPDYAETYSTRGNAFLALQQHEAALHDYDKVIALKPDHAASHNNRGSALQALKQYEAAVQSHEQALTLQPDNVDAYFNLGNALRELKQLDAALQNYALALSLKPDYPFLYGTWLHIKMQICDWSDAESQFTRLAEIIEQGENASVPFPVLAITGSLSLQRKVAQTWVQAKHPPSSALPAIPKHHHHDKIRIGYFSADFHSHATAHLMADLFEKHDRSKFELIAFSFGPEQNDEMRKRLVAAFDKFIDVRSHSDTEVALLARSLEIDIALDLKGFTQDSRPGIFAMRAAPIQVNYLGYPGTMGAPYIDYLIADSTLIPSSSQPFYSEKIAYLPYSYQANDAKRHIADKVFIREELGLPKTGFVFCCFNNNYKITPATFESWMRILRHVEGSVLWLLEDNPKAASNLSQQAVHRGIEAERLVFAKRLSPAEHLARHRLADLFLDTLPYNAHTTVSDALWAGLPVLTLMGEAFSSRVAASLLNAIHLPELITTTQEEYEARAIELATHPKMLGKIQHKLANNRLTTPLFDTPLFTRHIEAAYMQMHERHQSDLPPEHIHVMP
jgi:predicted O-linked N-acetylglucosamine transferase (SPINDLY family)